MQEQNHKAPWGIENFKKGENSRQHTIAPTSNCKILKEELWGTAMVLFPILSQDQQIWWRAFLTPAKLWPYSHYHSDMGHLNPTKATLPEFSFPLSNHNLHYCCFLFVLRFGPFLSQAITKGLWKVGMLFHDHSFGIPIWIPTPFSFLLKQLLWSYRPCINSGF